MSQPDETPPLIESIEEVIGAADTLRMHGSPTLLQVAVGIARSKIGQREDVDEDGNGLNTGDICDWSREGMTTRDGLPWCGFFACQCVRRAILALSPPEAAPLLVEWRAIDSGSCIELWTNLEARDLAVRAVPGQPPPIGAYFVFYVEIKRGKPVMKDGLPHLLHVGVVDRPVGALLISVSGNSTGQAVAENRPLLTDPKIWGYGLLPAWASG